MLRCNLPNSSGTAIGAAGSTTHDHERKRGRTRETYELDANDANEALLDELGYSYLTDPKRVRTNPTNDELIRSGRFSVGGWNADGSEQLVPILYNVSWVAWDAINSSRLGRKRQGEQIDEGRDVKRARFGDG